MATKFTKHLFSSVIFLILFSGALYSQINFVKTPHAIHLYRGVENQAFISLPLKPSFVEIAIVNQPIKDKLGSFKKEEKSIWQKAKIDTAWVVSENENTVIVKGWLKKRKFSSEFSLVFTSEENNILFNLTFSNPSINEITLRLATSIEEQIFGMGQQFSHVNLKGKTIHTIVEENGIGRGDKTITALASMVGAAGNEFTTYAPIPFFMTTKNRAFLLNNTEVATFDFSNNQLIEIELSSNQMSGYIWQADSPKELLTQYTQVSGRMPMLPEFVLDGAILGLQGGKEKIEEIIRKTLDYGTPVSAIWIQDWVGKRQTAIGSRLQWDWQANETVYPDFKNWCDSLNKINIKVLGYINPYMVEGGATADYALKNNFTVHDKNGKPYKFKAGGFNAYMIDFTNPEAYIWYQKIIVENMLNAGLSGWMIDFGEWLPFDAKLHSGISAKEYHNQYPVDWMKLNREVIDRSNRNDIFVFNRSGYTNSARYSLSFWAGDQMSNFGIHDGLPSAICALNSSGLSGISINHSDIGGYTAVSMGPFQFLRNEETLFRWMEMEAFTPIFRTHEGLLPEKMIQFYSNDNTLAYFAEMTKLNTSLKPLFQKFNQEASEFGWPIIRHPYLEFPEDANTYKLKYQFMLGDSLMIIPKINNESEDIEGYLPQGVWVDYFTNEKYIGGKTYQFTKTVVLIRR
jgi:sulfoquinovosidase